MARKFILFAQAPEEGWWFVASTAISLTPIHDGNVQPTYVAMLKDGKLQFLNDSNTFTAEDLLEIAALVQSTQKQDRTLYWTNQEGYPSLYQLPQLDDVDKFIKPTESQWVAPSNFYPSQSMPQSAAKDGTRGIVSTMNEKGSALFCKKCGLRIFWVSRQDMALNPTRVRDMAADYVYSHFACSPNCKPREKEERL